MSAYFNTARQIVDVQKITGFEFNPKTSVHYLILEDGHKEPRPLVHGFIPKVGDCLVTSAVVNKRPGGSPFTEKSEVYILPAAWVAEYFVPVPEEPVQVTKTFLSTPEIVEVLAEQGQDIDAAVIENLAADAPVVDVPAVTEPAFVPAENPNLIIDAPEIVEVPQSISSEVKEQ